MFAKLAFRNVRRQLRNYLIYFLTVFLSIALLFAVNNLSFSARIEALSRDYSDVRNLFTMVTVLSCLVTALVQSYAAGFMLKLRRREFGMYLTLGMTRRNIQTLFVCETGILTGAALAAGMGAGTVLFQLLAAMYSSILEIPFTVSAYSAKGILLTAAVSMGMFFLSTLVSLRYLKKVTAARLLGEETAQRGEKHPVLWCILSGAAAAAFIFCLVKTWQSMMAAFHGEDGVELLLWLTLDLVLVFLTHAALSRALAGMLLYCRRLKNSGTNIVVLRGMSGRMTVNALMIGALSTLLVFAVVLSNVAFGDKVFTDLTIEKECPYDVIALFDLSEEQGVSMQEGRNIIESYSPITAEIDYQLYSSGESTLSSGLPGYEIMGWTDQYMPLSRFNALLAGCGREPVTLDRQYLMVTTVQKLCDTDLSEKTVNLNVSTLSWGGSSVDFPEFARGLWMYYVVPDEALTGMPAVMNGAAYTLENRRPDAEALHRDLSWIRETEEGREKECSYTIQEYIRLYSKAGAGALIIGALYVSTVFVCMALAILSVKTLSTLEEERRRFAVLYRLGADTGMQKKALLQQLGAFFLMPFAFPLLMTVPLGALFARVYEIWNLPGLSGMQAVRTAVVIAFAMAGIFGLYFVITYRIACDHVISPTVDKSSKSL